MNKEKVAKMVSTFTNPPIICIPLFFIICLILSFENGTFILSKFIALELISLVFASILPMAIILYWAKKLNTDSDISKCQDRKKQAKGYVSNNKFFLFLIDFPKNLKVRHINLLHS